MSSIELGTISEERRASASANISATSSRRPTKKISWADLQDLVESADGAYSPAETEEAQLLLSDAPPETEPLGERFGPATSDGVSQAGVMSAQAPDGNKTYQLPPGRHSA